MDGATIRQQADKCLEQFRLLVKIEDEVQTFDNDCPGQDGYEATPTQEQLARFEMWAGNIGVFADGHASLDYRVRNSEDARRFMVEFLSTLMLALRKAIESLRPGHPLPQSPEVSESDSFDTSASSAVSSAFQGTEPETITPGPDESTNPVTDKLQFLERTIDRLFRLSKHIRRPSILRHNPKADSFPITDEAGVNIDVSFRDFALRIVAHRFPEITAGLRERLLQGVVLRRKRFLYRRSHQRKLSTPLVAMLSSSANIRAADYRNYEAESTIKGDRVLSESPVQEKGGFDEKLVSRSALSHTSASGEAQTSIPMEKVEHDEESNQSTVFTNTQTSSSPVQVPEPPKPVPGSKEFECPYCCTILPISYAKKSTWRRHIVQDLEPYVCIFENCSDDTLYFAERSRWLAHMRTSHASRWVCMAAEHKQSFYLHTEQDYEEHMRKSHPGSFTEPQLALLKTRTRVPVSAIFEQCPLCGWKPTPEELKTNILAMGWDEIPPDEVGRLASDRIAKHVAAHLEALYIKSLPWQDVEDEMKTESVVSQRAQEGSDGSEQYTDIHKSMSTISLLNYDEGSDTTPGTPVREHDESHYVPDGSYDNDWGFIPWPLYYGHDRDPVLQPLLRKLYLDASGPTDNAQGPKLPAYLVPLDPGKNFYSRGYALNAIKDALCPDPDFEEESLKPTSFPRCFAIYGPGGIGKTQIAAQFVATHRDRFDAVLWVYAENANKISQDFKDIVIGLGLIAEDRVDAKDLNYTRDILKRWLVNPLKILKDAKKERASWLLVFDGVENGDILNDFWPYDGPGSILITSRNPHSWSTSLELKPFSTHEATEYLLRITGRDVDDVERASVVAIAKRLGGLPLALAQMGSIISHQSISFSEFLRTYEGRGGQQELLHWPLSDIRPRPTNYENSVASIWAFDSLGTGATLLNILSMLDPDGIPESLFDHDDTKHDHPEVDELKNEYVPARNELLARSLVTGNKREKKLFIHRLVQDVLRARMSTTEIRQVFLTCVRLVSSKWPFELFAWRHGNARWDACEELFPHVSRLKDLFPEIVPSTDSFEDYEFARLLIDAGWYRHERGNATEAVYFNNPAQRICESLKLRILEDPACLSNEPESLAKLNYSLSEINHNRGCIALEINEPVSALTYHKLFNEMMIKELAGKTSHNDMRLAISWNELGNAYMLNKEWQRGLDCFLTSIEEMKRLNDFKPTMISLPLANVGLAYWLQGEYVKAETILSDGLQARKLEFGADDRISFITGRFLHALGNVKGSLDKEDEAHDYHRRTLMHYKTTLGNRHHRTADVFVKVADHNLNIGQYDMALALLDYALEAYSDSNHYLPEKMRASLKRSKALRALKKDEDADAELSKCFKIYAMRHHELVRSKMVKEADRKTKETELTDQDMIQFVAFWSR